MTVKESKKNFLKKITSENFKIMQELKDDDLTNVAELPLNKFLAVLSFENSQTCAPLFEDRLQVKGFKKVSASEEKGDFKTSFLKKNVELKVSFPNKGNKINMRQLRPWQDCDYLICFCDYYNKKHELYYLTHEQMLQEIKRRGKATHGTKEANKSNQKIEYSITLSTNNKDWEQYKDQRLFDLVFGDK